MSKEATDGYKLRALADWFDRTDQQRVDSGDLLEGDDEVQRDLRRMADLLDQYAKEQSKPKTVKAFLKGKCPRCGSDNFAPSKYKTWPDFTCECNWKFDKDFIVGEWEEVNVIVAEPPTP